MREVIFISHATPEDNDFTVWLASRLRFLGYNVWYDKAFLLGGEKFWQTIDQVIRNETVKFLFVYSEKVCSAAGILKDGIAKEFYLAESIAKQEKLKDFIIPLNIGAPYNHFIGIEVYNQVSFQKSWADGLNQLQEKLKKDQVPLSDINSDNTFLQWYRNEHLLPLKRQIILGKNEKYYSSWWRIPQLPEVFFVYKFASASQAKDLHKQQCTYPIAKISNLLISFADNMEFNIVNEGTTIKCQPIETYAIRTSDVLNGVGKTEYPSRNDAENYIKVLLQRIFHLLMKTRELTWYEMANKGLAYFYTSRILPSGWVKFKYTSNDTKPKRKSLFGEFKGLYWHFAVSAHPILSPFPAFNLKNHITFTTNLYEILKNEAGEIDSSKLHSCRRTKGKTFFNKEWRDLLIAFLHGLKKPERDTIEISLSKNFTLVLSSFTEMYNADFGYNDPSVDRIDILSSSVDESIDNDDEC